MGTPVVRVVEATLFLWQLWGPDHDVGLASHGVCGQGPQQKLLVAFPSQCGSKTGSSVFPEVHWYTQGSLLHFFSVSVSGVEMCFLLTNLTANVLDTVLGAG